MKTLNKYFLLTIITLIMISCKSDDNFIPNPGPENLTSNDITLSFNNTFKDTNIFLGDANSDQATVNTSANGQEHQFSELKYVISNIRLIKVDGTEVRYHVDDLDKGAVVVDQAKPASLNYVLAQIPAGEYKQIKFGLGVRNELNTLDQIKFPNFYANAGANDTQMMWEWGTGYRFTKIEGFYDTDKKPLSIHSGSTVEGSEGNYTQGVDSYRDITLDLSINALVGNQAPQIFIKADFDHLLSGKTNTITLSTGTGGSDNATPNVHTAQQMVRFVDNLGGNGTDNQTGMFSITHVEN